jgi:hypothetical protein
VYELYDAADAGSYLKVSLTKVGELEQAKLNGLSASS